MCRCYPPTKQGYHYVQWMGSYFRSCHYTPVQRAAFFFGLANIGWWLFAQFPQFILNFVKGDVEGLSFLFIMQWLLGDITNLLGAILTHQLPIQLYTAIYFCIMDCLLVTQYIYYRVKNKYIYPKKKRETEEVHSSRLDASEYGSTRQSSMSSAGSHKSFGLFAFFLVTMAGGQLFYGYTATGDMGEGLGVAGRVLLEVNHLGNSTHHEASCEATADVGEVAEIIGDICAWVSGVLYFFGSVMCFCLGAATVKMTVSTARIPQIWQNYRRKTTGGLSFVLFVCTMMGNTCYGLSIILQGIDFNEAFWRSTAAYLLGSICVIFLSMVIVLQMAYYDWFPRWKKHFRRLSGYEPVDSEASRKKDEEYLIVPSL